MLQDVASIASLLDVAVLGVGYYLLIKFYREWVGQRREEHVKTFATGPSERDVVRGRPSTGASY